MPSLSHERWKQIEALFDAAILVPPEKRGEFLDNQCPDEDMRRELLAMFASENETGPLGQIVGQYAAAIVDESGEALAGKLVGPYRILRQIGKGGMGAVFLAARDDDQFRKEVAIKALNLEASVPGALSRFRHERQILAALEHSNIARMLDGGATDEGTPYIVMEYVAGIPITDYCRDRALSIPARLRLFQQVCDAVQYAHQMLLVHRDIKPANILVTGDGVVKLLDFGIAKLLDQSAQEATRTAAPMMTPEYASPEQVRGDAVSTATDVYSLGMVLQEMLTGRLPYEIPSRSPGEIAHAVCETPPAPAGISDDIDNIILLALRKEPHRRYATVEQFSDDISRALDNRPVRARPDTLAYRARKFARRNRLALTAAVLLIVTLLGGVAVSLYQARRAERRFQDVREMANVFLLQFDETIRDLPGSTKPRELLVSTALKYLDRLSAEASGDLTLLAELATAYDKVGDVQGNPAMPNLGRVTDALVSWQRSRSLWDRVLAKRPDDIKALRSAADVTIKSASLITKTKDGSSAGMFREATALADRALSLNPVDEETLFSLARVWSITGEWHRGAGDRVPAIEAHNKGLAIYRRGAAQWPTDRWNSRLALSLGVMASLTAAQGDPVGAVKPAKEALAIRRELAARNPLGVSFQRGLAGTLQMLGNRMGAPSTVSVGDTIAAEPYYREAIAIQRKLAKADPADESLKADMALSTVMLGEVMVDRDAAGARACFRETLDIIDSMKTGASRADIRKYRGIALTGLAKIEGFRKDYPTALRHADLGIATLKTTSEQVDLLRATLVRGDLLRAMGKSAEARTEWDRARAMAGETPVSSQDLLELRYTAETYSRLGTPCSGLRTEWLRRKTGIAFPVPSCN